MKQFFLLTLITVVACSVASARIRIPFGEREVLTQVAELPNTPEYATGTAGKYIDLACLHTEYNVAFLPLWITKEPVLVGYNAAEGTYLELTDDALNAILQKNGLKKEELLQLGFFTRYGGKLVGLCIIALIIYGFIPSKKKEVKPVVV